MRLSRVAMVFNPMGGSSNARRAQLLRDCLRSLPAQVSLLSTSSEPDSGMVLAKNAAADGADIVVAFGGDGTVCQVAEGLLGTDVPLAVFPGGTGNLFAKTYYPTPTTQQFAAMLQNGAPQPVDMVKLSYLDLSGNLYERHFLNGFCVGPIGDAISGVKQRTKRVFGMLAYVATVVRSQLNPVPCRFNLRCDVGGVNRECVVSSVALAATNTMPPLMTMLSRGCSASDGMIDVFSIDARSAFDWIPIIGWTLRLKPERSRRFYRWRTARMVIDSDTPVVPNIDGDVGPPTRSIELSVRTGAISAFLAEGPPGQYDD